MASLALPVETRIASFSRLAGMSLSGVTRPVSPGGGAVSGVASSSCITSFKTAASSCASITGGYIYVCFSFQ